MADSVHVIDPSQRTAAKVVGLAYLIPVAFILMANFWLRANLFVRGDMAETIRRIVAAEAQFRLSVAFDVVYCVGVVVLLAALYVVLSPVSRHLAVLASVLKLIYGMTAVLMSLSYLTIVRLATDPAYQTLQPEVLQSLVRISFAAPTQQYYVGLAFWALSATVFGWLWLKSGYIPAGLAWAGIVSAAWCAFCTFAYIINPGFSNVVNLWVFDTPFALFDITLSFWLLFRGLRSRPFGVRPL